MEQTSFAKRRPYLFTALIVLIIVAVYLLAGTATVLLRLPFPLYLIANTCLALIFAALLTGMHWWREVGFRALPSRRTLWLYTLPFVPVLGNLIFGIKAQGWGHILTYLVLATLVGFVEEVAFRGLILRALAPRGLWRAAILSAILFGLAHSMNALAGSNSAYVLLQIGYAMAFGFGWASVTLRTGVLWPLVIIHGLIDFAGFTAADQLGATGVDATLMVMAAAYIVAFTIYGIYMLRSIRPSEPGLEANPIDSQ